MMSNLDDSLKKKNRPIFVAKIQRILSGKKGLVPIL
jgi:hypothetical protein